MAWFADDFTIYSAKNTPHEARRAVSNILGNVAAWYTGNEIERSKSLARENSRDVCHT